VTLSAVITSVTILLLVTGIQIGTITQAANELACLQDYLFLGGASGVEEVGCHPVPHPAPQLLTTLCAFLVL